MVGNIEYIADTFLIERTFRILAWTKNKNIVKEAQLESVLGNIAGSIKSFVGSQVHGQDSGGITRTLVNLLAPATFFRLHPILGILMTIGQSLGVDLYSIFNSIMGAVKPHLDAGQPVPPEEINEAAKAAISGVTTASLLYPLYELEKSGDLAKIAASNEGAMQRMFSFLGRKRGSSLLAGILAWFVKTILMSAGMLFVGGATTKALGIQPVQQSGQSAAYSFNTGPNQSAMHDYRPNPEDLWIEALDGQEPHERLLQWVSEAYPDLYQYQDIIVKVPAFWQAVRGISRNWTPGKSQMSIPQPYKTRNDILSLFMNDVFKEIQKGKQ